ncbi:MAG: hypothetical protein M1828_005011 [Chrysothrix sp. TS-e1954]|nr:MAG: hypothetical protein M1828_005011 [Chrysothrix sp. TS-e1954]
MEFLIEPTRAGPPVRLAQCQTVKTVMRVSLVPVSFTVSLPTATLATPINDDDASRTHIVFCVSCGEFIFARLVNSFASMCEPLGRKDLPGDRLVPFVCAKCETMQEDTKFSTYTPVTISKACMIAWLQMTFAKWTSSKEPDYAKQMLHDSEVSRTVWYCDEIHRFLTTARGVYACKELRAPAQNVGTSTPGIPVGDIIFDSNEFLRYHRPRQGKMQRGSDRPLRSIENRHDWFRFRGEFSPIVCSCYAQVG